MALAFSLKQVLQPANDAFVSRKQCCDAIKRSSVFEMKYMSLLVQCI